MSTPETLEKFRRKYPSRIRRGKAIQLYCKFNCCAGDGISWKECSQKSCFLWAYRLGREIIGNQIKSTKTKRKTSQNLRNQTLLKEEINPIEPIINKGIEKEDETKI